MVLLHFFDMLEVVIVTQGAMMLQGGLVCDNSIPVTMHAGLLGSISILRDIGQGGIKATSLPAHLCTEVGVAALHSVHPSCTQQGQYRTSAEE